MCSIMRISKVENKSDGPNEAYLTIDNMDGDLKALLLVIQWVFQVGQ